MARTTPRPTKNRRTGEPRKVGQPREPREVPIKPRKPTRAKTVKPNAFDRDDCITRICNTIATTEKGVYEILMEDNDGTLPVVTTFWVWMREDEWSRHEGEENLNMAARYATAKAQQTHFMAEQAKKIADEVPATNRFGEVDSGAVRHQDLRVRTRFWLMERLNSRVYGNKTILAGDVEAPLIGKKQDLSKLTDAELQTLLALQEKIEKT